MLLLWPLSWKVNEGRAFALSNQGVAHYRLSNLEKAIELQNDALDVAEDAGILDVQFTALYVLALAHYDQEDVESAIDFYQRRLTLSRESNAVGAELQSLLWLGSAYLDSGQYTDAIASFDELSTLSEERKQPAFQRWGQSGLGFASVQLQDYPAAPRPF